VKRLPLIVLLLATACVPQVGPAPEPQQLTVALSPTEVVQRAARVLTAQGFEIQTSDAAAGVLRATRVREKTGNAAFQKCAHNPTSMSEEKLRSTVTVSLSATPANGGTAVQVGSRVLSQWPSLTGVLAMADSDTHCVSTGEAEKLILAALQ